MLRGYNFDNYTERALSLLEKDICYLAHTNWGYGMSSEDVAQELRIHLWNKIDRYNPNKKSLRTWAQQVMRMRLIDMSRHANRVSRFPIGGIISFDEFSFEEVTEELIYNLYDDVSS